MTRSHPPFEWNARERALFRRLRTPHDIQDYLTGLRYRNESIYCAPRQVIEDRRAHCYDSALFAAAALRMQGRPPLIVDLRSSDNDDDHVIAVFKEFGCYGAVGKSNYVGLAWREPVYRNIRELALSYFDFYFNLRGELTLREYSQPLDLTRFDRLRWMYESTGLEAIAEKLDRSPHRKILSRAQERALHPVDKRTLAAGCLGVDKRGCFPG